MGTLNLLLLLRSIRHLYATSINILFSFARSLDRKDPARFQDSITDLTRGYSTSQWNNHRCARERTSLATLEVNHLLIGWPSSTSSASAAAAAALASNVVICPLRSAQVNANWWPPHLQQHLAEPRALVGFYDFTCSALTAFRQF